VLASVVQPANTRLSRLEKLLLEMQTDHALTLKKIRQLSSEEMDELTATVVTRRLM
jgi:hypothetical protein